MSAARGFAALALTGTIAGWGRGALAFRPLSGDTSGAGIVDDGVSINSVLREGGLQDKPGPSIAAEFGVLLPEIRGEQGTGASLAGVLSQQWAWAGSTSTPQRH
jgi:hypothetical protein